MGANFHYYIYRESVDCLEEFHRDYQQELCHEQGSETYQGHLGVLPSGLRFAEIEAFAEVSEAIEHLEDNHYKWNCALAVPFHGELRQHDCQSKRILAQRKKTKQGLVLLENKFLQQIKSTKSKTIGCKSCGSSVSRSLLAEAVCPVCSGSLYSTTQSKQLEAKKAKLRQTSSPSHLARS